MYRNMGLSSKKGNSGYIGLDKRGEVASTGTTGSVSVRKHYLERKRGNFCTYISMILIFYLRMILPEVI